MEILAAKNAFLTIFLPPKEENDGIFGISEKFPIRGTPFLIENYWYSLLKSLELLFAVFLATKNPGSYYKHFKHFITAKFDTFLVHLILTVILEPN